MRSFVAVFAALCSMKRLGKWLAIYVAVMFAAPWLALSALTPDQIEHRRQAFAKRNARTNDPSYLGAIWTEEELSMLGTRPDAEVAVLVGRTVEAVAIQRRKRGIAPFA